MTGFENYLIKIGFIKHKYNFKTDILEPCGNEKHIISTMVNICYFYIKNEKIISFGLNILGKPPTLINPRPLIRVEYKSKDMIQFNPFNDDYMNKNTSRLFTRRNI